MRSLGLGLFAEGPADYRFLSVVLRRLADDLCVRCQEPVEIPEMMGLDAPPQFRGAARDEQIFQAVRPAEDALHILFLHTDGGGDVRRAVKERVEPGRQRIQAELGWRAAQVVGVVPVREVEAWALADGAALRLAFGTELADQDLGLPRHAREVEQITDPKQALEGAYRAVTGARRRRKTAAEFLEVIAEVVHLERLRLLPAFRRCEEEIEQALRELRYIV